MSFATPWWLLGLLLLLPLLWTHLFHRRQSRVSLPTLSILQSVEQRRQRTRQFRQIALLLLRALIIILFITAAARPLITVWRRGGIRTGGQLDMVILLDDSGSMRRKNTDGTTLFTLAQNAARAEIQRLRPDDRVMVVLGGAIPRPLNSGLTTGKDTVVTHLDKTQASMRSGQLDRAMMMANQILASSMAPQKEVVVISDHPGPGDPSSDRSSAKITVRWIEVQKTAVSDNVSIDQVTVAPSNQNQDQGVSVTAKISNRSQRPANHLSVALTLDQTFIARGIVDIPPLSTVEKTFHHSFETNGLHVGKVTIPSDALDLDNTRYFATRSDRAPAVLIINDDFMPGSYLDEAFYLTKALEAADAGERPIRLRMEDPLGADNLPLGDYDAIFAIGVGTLTASLSDRLTRYVENGGGLFISPGANPDLSFLKAVAPGQFTSVRHYERSPQSIGTVNWNHPLFKPLAGGPSGLEQVHVHGCGLVAPDPTISRQTLVALKNGLPLLLERQADKGRVLLLTTSIDRDWTNLPIMPGFVPFIQRSVRYLAEQLAHQSVRFGFPGEAMPISIDQNTAGLSVLLPGGKQRVFSGRELADKPQVWFKQTTTPGFYRVRTQSPYSGGLKEQPDAAFLINADPAESEFAPLETAKPTSHKKSQTNQAYPPIRSQLPVYSILLMLGLLLLLTEGFASGIGLSKNHQRSHFLNWRRKDRKQTMK